MLIRNALVSEVELLTELQRRASLVWEEYRADLLAHPEVIEVPVSLVEAGAVRVAVLDGVVIGFSAVLAEGDAVELDGLFVEPGVMRSGVGRLLVSDVIERAHTGGASRVEVTANPRALGFYEKVGFVTVGTTETEFGPAIRMHLTVR